MSNVLANTIRRNSTCTLVEWKYIYIYIKNAASTVFCSNYIIHVVSIFTKYPDGDSICSNGTLVKILNNASNIDLLIM